MSQAAEVVEPARMQIPRAGRRSPPQRLAVLVRSSPHARLFGIAALAFAVGLAVAVRDDRHILFDDAAITMRYAYRLAHGDGFTYNPGDRTDGASSPLYTLLLALMSLCGAGLVASAKVICVVSYAGTTAGVSWLAGRIGGWLGAVAAPVFLMLSLNFRMNALSGMESSLACLLGVATIIALTEKRYTTTGVLLGLCMVNKLDAVALAVAIGVALLVTQRKIPLKIIGWSAAVLAPWLVFSQAYFGSVVPHSASTKINVLATGTHLDHRWIYNVLRTDHYGWIMVLALGAVVIVAAGKRSAGLGIVMVLCLWPTLHGLAFSLVNLGGDYGWYTTAVYPGIAAAAGVAVGVIGADCYAPLPGDRVRAAAPLALGLLLVAVFVPFKPSWTATESAFRHGHVEDGYEEFERTRADTGVYLAAHAHTGDVVETCFGWPAFLAEQTVIKETCPLSTRKPVASPRWFVNVGFPDVAADTAAPGFGLVYRSVSPGGGQSSVYSRS